MKRLLSSQEAAVRLGVKPTTLYAYVSRGLLRSHLAEDGRARRYDSRDIEVLRQRSDRRRRPERAAAAALFFGDPVLESGISLIADDRLYYRGLPADELALTRSLEEVAAWLWCSDFGAVGELFTSPLPPLSPEAFGRLDRFAGFHPCTLLQAALVDAEAADPSAADLRRSGLLVSGARILQVAVAAVARLQRPARGSMARILARHWAKQTSQEAETLLRTALVLCADHELNVSSFTARCVISAGATPYHAAIAGLSALRGHRHGGHTERVEALRRELGFVAAAAPPGRAEISRRLQARLQRGERIPGFGHPLYPGGDPRCALLLELLGRHGGSREMEAMQVVAEEAERILDEKPTVDFGVVAVAAHLGLGPSGAWTIFALGRIVGWVAHALEEAERGRLIRPRASYCGPPPAPA